MKASDLSLVPLEEHSHGRERKPVKLENKKRERPPRLVPEQDARKGAAAPPALSLVPQASPPESLKPPSFASQAEGPWSYKKQHIPTVQPSLPHLAAQSPDFVLPRLDVAPNKAQRQGREESSPAGSVFSPSSAKSPDMLPEPRRHSSKTAPLPSPWPPKQQQQQQQQQQGGGDQSPGGSLDTVHLAQHYGGENPAAAAAAAFASGYKTVEAMQLQNLQVMEKARGVLSLDTAELQALQRSGALSDAQLQALQRGIQNPLNRSPTPLSSSWMDGQAQLQLQHFPPPPLAPAAQQQASQQGPNASQSSQVKSPAAAAAEPQHVPVRTSRFGPGYIATPTGEPAALSAPSPPATGPFLFTATHAPPAVSSLSATVPSLLEGSHQAPAGKAADPLSAVFESIAGHLYDPVEDGLRQIDSSTGLPAVPPHAITRKALLLKVPVIDEALRLEVPAVVEDRSGHACLVILPSDKPPGRSEALAVEGLLRELLREPLKAAHKAAVWRSHVLNTMCSDAMAAVRKGMYGPVLSHNLLRYAWIVNTAGRPSSLTPHLVGQELGLSSVSDLLENSPRPGSLTGGDTERQRQQQQQQQQQEQQQQKQQKPTAARRRSQFVTKESKKYTRKVGAEQLPSYQRVVATLSMAVATSICMADIIRQVEIQCGERGRVLAYTWNAYLSTHEDTMWHIHKENARLLQENNSLAGEVTELKNHIEGIEFLRREVVRFRKMLQVDAYNSGQLLKENLNFRESQDETAKYLQAVELTVHRQLARLRWQHAFHVLGTREKRMLLTSGSLGEPGDFNALTRKVAMVRELAAAVMQAEKRKRAFGTKRRATDFEHDASFHEVVKSSLAAAYQERWDLSGAGSLEDVIEKLPSLQQEAQVLVLASMKDSDRWAVYEALTPEHRAALLVIMSPQMREQARMAISKKAWLSTLQTMDHSNNLAASLLQVMELHEAVTEFSKWDMDKQMEVLGAMNARGDAGTAAAILKRIPDTMRLALAMKAADTDPALLAKILQVLDPHGIFKCLDGINEQLHSNVIMLMDTPKAAQVLTEMHYEDAAQCLLHEADEARRNAVLENMPHKGAANVLLMLDHLDKVKEQERVKAEQQAAKEAEEQARQQQQEQQQQRQGVDEDSDSSGEQEQGEEKRRSLAGSALLSMKQTEANGIIGHISYEDRANIIRSMDPSKVSEMMALMPPAEAVSLLAALSDVSLSVVSERLPKHEKERLLQALGGEPATPRRPKQGSWREKLNASRKPGHNVTIDQPRKEEVKELQGRAMDEVVAGSDAEKQSSDSSSSSESSSSSTESEDSEARARRERKERKQRRSKDGKAPIRSRDLRRSSTSGAAQQPVQRTASINERAVRRTSTYNTDVDVPERITRRTSTTGRGITSGGATSPEPFSLSGGNKSTKEPDEPSLGGRRASSTSGVGFGSSAVRPTHTTIPEELPYKGLKVQVEGDEANTDADSKSPGPLSTSQSSKGTGRGGRKPQPQTSPLKGRGSMTPSMQRKLSLLSKPPATPQAAVKAHLRSTPEGQRSIGAASERVKASNAASIAWEELLEGKQGGSEMLGETMSKLGNMPKNARLVEAITQHRDEAPRPKGWLLAVVDAVYKEGEVMLRKQGRIEVLRKQTLPDIVFFHFMNKYGQRKVANRYVGSLVNSLMLHRTQDQRLENFAKFLSEEWDLSTFVDFLTAQSMLLQPARIACAEYAKEPGREEGYAWACYHKCMYVADAVLGACSPEVRERFHTICFEHCEEVDAATVERARKEKQVGPNEPFPDRLFRMPRYLFLRLLCTEIQRINGFIANLAREKFVRLDNQRTGQVPVECVPTYISQMLAPDTPEDASQAAQLSLVQFAAAFERSVPITEVQVEDVQTISEEFFVQASVHNVPIRQHIKMNVLNPAPFVKEVDEGEIYANYLMGVTRRHAQVLMPRLHTWLVEDSGDVLLRGQAAAVANEVKGDAKFRAYLHLLAGVINMKVTQMVERIMKLHHEDTNELESSLCRLEDIAIVLLHKEEFLMANTDGLLHDRMARLPLSLQFQQLGHICSMHKDYKRALHAHAAVVLQHLWRARHARFVQAEAAKRRNRDRRLTTLDEGEEEAPTRTASTAVTPRAPPRQQPQEPSPPPSDTPAPPPPNPSTLQHQRRAALLGAAPPTATQPQQTSEGVHPFGGDGGGPPEEGKDAHGAAHDGERPTDPTRQSAAPPVPSAGQSSQAQSDSGQPATAKTSGDEKTGEPLPPSQPAESQKDTGQIQQQPREQDAGVPGTGAATHTEGAMPPPPQTQQQQPPHSSIPHPADNHPQPPAAEEHSTHASQTKRSLVASPFAEAALVPLPSGVLVPAGVGVHEQQPSATQPHAPQHDTQQQQQQQRLQAPPAPPPAPPHQQPHPQLATPPVTALPQQAPSSPSQRASQPGRPSSSGYSSSSRSASQLGTPPNQPPHQLPQPPLSADDARAAALPPQITTSPSPSSSQAAPAQPPAVSPTGTTNPNTPTSPAHHTERTPPPSQSPPMANPTPANTTTNSNDQKHPHPSPPNQPPEEAPSPSPPQNLQPSTQPNQPHYFTEPTSLQQQQRHGSSGSSSSSPQHSSGAQLPQLAIGGPALRPPVQQPGPPLRRSFDLSASGASTARDAPPGSPFAVTNTSRASMPVGSRAGSSSSTSGLPPLMRDRPFVREKEYALPERSSAGGPLGFDLKQRPPMGRPPQVPIPRGPPPPGPDLQGLVLDGSSLQSSKPAGHRQSGHAPLETPRISQSMLESVPSERLEREKPPAPAIPTRILPGAISMQGVPENLTVPVRLEPRHTVHQSQGGSQA